MAKTMPPSCTRSPVISSRAWAAAEAPGAAGAGCGAGAHAAAARAIMARAERDVSMVARESFTRLVYPVRVTMP